MKRVLALLCAGVIIASAPVLTASASGLDALIESNTEATTGEQTTGQENTGNSINTYVPIGNQSLLDNMKDSTNLDGNSPGAEKINSGVKKVASFIVQVLAYFTTAMLVVKVAIDLCYIAIPFSRSILANGYAGQAMGGAQPGMGGGMGMGSGMGMGGGFGMNRMGGMGMGMNHMGGGMGMGMQNAGQPGANPAMGRIQWVSTAAMNAVASENTPGPDGRPVSPMKAYAKEMIIILVITPVFLTLAVTGTLTQLGFLLGSLLANAVSNIGGMF